MTASDEEVQLWHDDVTGWLSAAEDAQEKLQTTLQNLRNVVQHPPRRKWQRE